MTHNEPLTLADAMAIAYIIETVVGNKYIARALPEDKGGGIVFGTARRLSGPDGSRRPDDVRDTYLEVTTESGWQVWWPLSELIPEQIENRFLEYQR